LYQGRFKSFPVQAGSSTATGRSTRTRGRGDDPDRHLLTVCRYVERNAVRAGLARRAAAWRWGSAWARANSDAAREMGLEGLLHEPWPVQRPADWERLLDEPQSAAEQEAVLHSITRGRPLGDETWVGRTAAKLGLEHTLRPPGRPKKERPAGEGASGRRGSPGKGRGAGRKGSGGRTSGGAA
jgi:putative transposase